MGDKWQAWTMVFPPARRVVERYRAWVRVRGWLTRTYPIRKRWEGQARIQYFTILDRNILDSWESWLFSWFFNHFQMFCQFETYDKRYGRVMKRIWDINTVFSTITGKLVFAKFICSLQRRGLIILFLSLKLGQISNIHGIEFIYRHTYL